METNERKPITYVLRGGALLSQPKAWLSFGESNDTIVVPMGIEEKLRTFKGAKKRYADKFSEYLSTLPTEDLLSEDGAIQDNGTFLKVGHVLTNFDEKIKKIFSPGSSLKITDELSAKESLQICKNIQHEICKEENLREEVGLKSPAFDRVILVSTNKTLRLLANDLGIKTESVADLIYPLPQDQYTGATFASLPIEAVEELRTKGYYYLSKLNDEDRTIFFDDAKRLYENEFVNINNNAVLTRYSAGALHLLTAYNRETKPIRALNNEQKFAMEGLYKPAEEAPLVIIEGVAGTGKSALSILTGIDQLENKNRYARILISTPVVSGSVTGESKEEYGFLPGGINEKLRDNFGGIIDNLTSYFRKEIQKKNTELSLAEATAEAEKKLEDYFERGIIKILPLAKIGGESLENVFLIVDEAQNVSPQYFIDIVTRMGENSKLVITGDPGQVKVPSLDSRVNGITYMMELWKKSKFAYQVKMRDDGSVRSALCKEAIKLMG